MTVGAWDRSTFADTAELRETARAIRMIADTASANLTTSAKPIATAIAESLIADGVREDRANKAGFDVAEAMRGLADHLDNARLAAGAVVDYIAEARQARVQANAVQAAGGRS